MHMLLATKYNATKSFSLCFKPNQIKINIPSFVLGKPVIPAVDKCKYLDILVSETNCDDLKRQMQKYYANAKYYYKHSVTLLQV